MMVLQSSAATWAPSGSAFSSLSNMAAGTPAITLAFQVAGKGRKEGPIFFRTLSKVPVKCLDLYWPHRSYTDTPSCDGDWEMSRSWVPCAEIEVGVLLLRRWIMGTACSLPCEGAGQERDYGLSAPRRPVAPTQAAGGHRAHR